MVPGPLAVLAADAALALDLSVRGRWDASYGVLACCGVLLAVYVQVSERARRRHRYQARRAMRRG